MNHYIDNVVNRYADLAGVHRIQAKELRTSHACLLINKYNADILAVSQRLGMLSRPQHLSIIHSYGVVVIELLLTN